MCLTPEQYLEMERAADVRGPIDSRAGGSAGHHRITRHLGGLLRAHLEGHPCEVFAHQTTWRPTPDRYCIPDLVLLRQKMVAPA
jgi:hypothetical protein